MLLTPRHSLRRAMGALLFAVISLCSFSVAAHEDTADNESAVRAAAEQRIYWHRNTVHGIAANRVSVKAKILGINDFHGQLSAGRRVANRPVGGAAVLASYLKTASADMEGNTLIVHAGDHVGASPPVSALLQDEPSIMFFNTLANDKCTYRNPYRARCNIVATLGNHEFDEGTAEMFRLINGGNHAAGPFLEDPFRGARYPHVSANVINAVSKKPILPPYVIKQIDGMPIAFIGAVLKDTPTIVTPSGVAGLQFLDEAEAINRYIPELKQRGVRAIVVLIHQGGRQSPIYTGETKTDGKLSGAIADIVSRLDDEVDIVVSGHAHSFTNAFVKTASGKDILVTQAFSSGTAYADIDLEIDRVSRDIIKKSAAVITTYADAGPGLTPDAEVAALVKAAEDRVAPLVSRVVGDAAIAITRDANTAGESALGNLIADTQRAAMNTDFAFMNPGGIRADLDAGPVTWGELFTVQPFSNTLVKMTLTGQQIYDLLNQQWAGQPFPRILQISGLSYTWDMTRPANDRVVEVRKNGVAIERSANFTVVANSFIADGGDNFTVLKQGTNRVVGPVDLDALVTYIESLTQPFSRTIEGRIVRLN